MSIALVWFRQDLRLTDNPAFKEACDQHQIVIPLYIFDKNSVLGSAQQWWLHHSLQALHRSLEQFGLNLVLRQGPPLQILNDLIKQYSIKALYWNRCYEPLVIERDKEIKAALVHQGIKVTSFNANLLNEPWTIQNKSGTYFKVYTPYWKHCLQTTVIPALIYPLNRPQNLEIPGDRIEDWSLLPHKPNWAVEFATHWQPGEEGALQKLEQFIDVNLMNYKVNRDFPAYQATSRLSPHLHFGEISPWVIWRAVEMAKLDPACDLDSAQHFLSELGWREFSYHLLYHFPQLPDTNFKKQFDAFPWDNNDAILIRWQRGQTGYPIIDAGMRELWATGYMHNRVRMIVASFLTKDLLIDWRIGAEWFLDTLVDADLANNSASWQWVAGSGADAAPYFRIFNPGTQSIKFDPQGTYIRQWVPELAKVKNQFIHQPWTADSGDLGLQLGKDYPQPMINHDEARKRALEYYKIILASH